MEMQNNQKQVAINNNANLAKFKKKGFFTKIVEEIKSIFAKEPDENLISGSGFMNSEDDFKISKINQLSEKIENGIANKKEVTKNINPKLNNIPEKAIDNNQNININIDPNKSANESEIVKRRAKHLVTDSLNERIELEDLSYYDLKILYNELIKE